VLALAVLGALGLLHKSQWQEVIYHPLPKPANLLKTSFPTDRSKGSAPQTRSVIPYKRPPTRQDIGEAIKYLGEVKNFYLFGWSIQFKKIRTEGFTTKYEAIATQKGTEEYLYRVAMEDFPFTGKRIFIDPPVLLRICANGMEAGDGECDDHSKPESVIKQ
jgi:hypothetical protein